MTTATYAATEDREELARRVDGLHASEAALGDAIAWVWLRLRDAGCTDRGTARRAVAVTDDEGAPSERAVSSLWAELRELGAERNRARAEARELCALLEAPPPPHTEEPTMAPTTPPTTTATVSQGGEGGTRWVVTWQSPAMPAPAFWEYPTQADAESAAASLRGETTAPLPGPPPKPKREPRPSTSIRTEATLYAAASPDPALLTKVYGPELVVIDDAPAAPASSGWDLGELDAQCAAEVERQDAERAAKLEELVAPAYAGRLCRLPGETGRQYRRRKRIRPTPEPTLAREGLSAAYLRELRRLHDSGVLDRAETRKLMNMPPPLPWWRRVLGAQDVDLGGYGVR